MQHRTANLSDTELVEIGLLANLEAFGQPAMVVTNPDGDGVGDGVGVGVGAGVGDGVGVGRGVGVGAGVGVGVAEAK